MNSEDITVDVVVVGAGLSGLVAARRLDQAGVTSLRVLEAKDRVGGRTKVRTLGNGQVVEDGGQLIGPEYHRLLALGEELNVSTWAHYDQGMHVLERGGRRLFFDGSMPWRSDPLGSADFVQSLLRLDRAARRCPTDGILNSAEAARLDAVTFASWVADSTRTATARTYWAIIGALTIGAQPGELSLLYVLRHLRALGGVATLLASLSGGNERSFTGGSIELSLRMAAALGDRVVLDSPVRRIRHHANGVEVVTPGQTYHARRAIIAMSPADREGFRFEPRLPGPQRIVGERLGMAHAYKVHVVYPEPFWRAKGLSGSIMSDLGPLPLTFDDTPPEGRQGVIVGFGRSEGGPNWCLPDALPHNPDQRRQAVLNGLARALGDQALHPDEYHEINWTDEDYTTGCIPVWPTGLVTACGPTVADAVGRLHWAGTELSPRWAGTMEGAVITGERAAAEITDAIEAESTVRVAG